MNHFGSPPPFEPPPHISDLLALLKNPLDHSADLSFDRWDMVVRSARTLRLLGTVGARLEACGRLDALPRSVRIHFEAALAVARFRRQKVLFEMDAVDGALGNFDKPIVLLKGAAYIAQGLALAEGRLVGDLDLLVSREYLDEIEARLLAVGWESLKPDPYDQNYYRAWSHELPPLQFPGHSLELDVHHNILPPTGRLHPNSTVLLENAERLQGSRYSVLHPVDQVLHAAAHLFQDSDCVMRARDLVDIDDLIRGFVVREAFWPQLLDHAHRHQLTRPLWYALDCGQAILGTPVPEEVWRNIVTERPGPSTRRAMRFLLPKALFTAHPDRLPNLPVRLVRSLLLLRSFWLRMPLYLLIRHTAAKFIRNFRQTSQTSD